MPLIRTKDVTDSCRGRMYYRLAKYYNGLIKGCRMGRSDKVSLWYVPLLINTRFRCFILE